MCRGLLFEDVDRLAGALHVVVLAGVALHECGVGGDVVDEDAVALNLRLVVLNLVVALPNL